MSNDYGNPVASLGVGGLPYDLPRQLVVHWDPTLIALSWFVSFLGAYAASQVCCQSSLCSRHSLAFYAWNGLAAILFGLCSIWSLHFVAMLAAQFEVAVSLSPGVTVFSAVIAVVFTWLALVSDSFTAKYLRRKKRKARKLAREKEREQLRLAAADQPLTEAAGTAETDALLAAADAVDVEHEGESGLAGLLRRNDSNRTATTTTDANSTTGGTPMSTPTATGQGAAEEEPLLGSRSKRNEDDDFALEDGDEEDDDRYAGQGQSPDRTVPDGPTSGGDSAQHASQKRSKRLSAATQLRRQLRAQGGGSADDDADDDDSAAPPMTRMKKELNEACHIRALALDDSHLSGDSQSTQPSTPRSIMAAPRTFPEPETRGDSDLLAQATANLSSSQGRSIPSGSLPRPLQNDGHKRRRSSPSVPFSSRLLSSSILTQNSSNAGSHPAQQTQTSSARHTPRTSQTSSRRPSLSFFSRKWSSGTQNGGTKSSTNASSTDLSDTTGSIDKYAGIGGGAGSSMSESGDTSSHSTSTTSYTRGLPLTAREKHRLKRGLSLSSGSLYELLLTLWGDCTVETIAKAGIWSLAIVAMHYSGMSAFRLDRGFAHWDVFLVLASALIAWVVCLAGLLFMPNMEVNISRQLAFSFLAASGVFAMHYTGMSAATFYSSAPPTDVPGYPPALGWFIVSFAILTCLISTTLVSHAATLSRNKLLEMIHVKQQLWRTLAQKEAVEATVALQAEFTSVAAHELRTPLYTITGYIDLLSRTRMDEEQALYVETVRRACHTIQLITTNVLDFTRLERANDEAQARPVLIELRKFICNLAEITEDRGPRVDGSKSGLELIVDIPDDVPEFVYLDETYLTRVIMNLVNNAVKFCSTGYIRLAAEKDGSSIKLTVTDTGIGIPKRFLERIFEPFRQADTTLTRVNNGSGLGLAICKRLVARLDGKIFVTSQEGEGSTFHVTLSNVKSTSAEPSPQDERVIGQRSIMVFAESAKVEKCVSEAWSRRGLRVMPRSDDESAWRRVDFIWTDLPTLVKHKPELLAFIKDAPTSSIREGESPFPYFLVIYSAETELLCIPPSAYVVPFKRPLSLHILQKILNLPKSELPTTLNKEKPKLVRFASIHSSAPSEASEDTTPATSVGDEDTNNNNVNSSSGGGGNSRQNLAVPSSDQALALNSSQIPKKTILLVEDNLVNSKLGERMLATLGYNVIVAYNGLEAFEAVKMAHDEIYAVLMDLQMPVMSGEESTALIRQYETDHQLSRMTIIALSANVNNASSTKIMDAGADGFAGKPISMKGLDEALSRYATHVD